MGSDLSSETAGPPGRADARHVDVSLAERLFDELARRTGDRQGITRMSFGLGEQIAHDMVTREARRLGLGVETDSGGNLYLCLKGVSDEPGIFIGSHLDSVPRGGNFDGAAGVLMGLCVAQAYIDMGTMPERDLTIMAIRAEESTWFGASYIGSRAAFGLLTAAELDSVFRSSDGVTLGKAIDAAGGSTAALKAGQRFLTAGRVGLFIEPHIEQGPVLEGLGLPAGIVTGVRGSFRYRHARCVGHYAHSGATPRDFRSDAVAASAMLVARLDDIWEQLLAEGEDLVVTFGQFFTDPSEAAFSKIAGRLDFSLDIRSQDEATLSRVHALMLDAIATIEARYSVRFELGRKTTSKPARMADDIVARLEKSGRDAGIKTRIMPSGAGHDAAVFADAGVPTGMVFIRNAHGSHNPHEAMDIADFSACTDLLAGFCFGHPLGRPHPSSRHDADAV